MRVLIVDPNPLFLQAAANFLASLPGCDAMTAGSAEEALRLALAENADVIVLDFTDNGIEWARHFKRGAHPPAVVVLSPEDAPAYRAACLEAGADACLDKTHLDTDLPVLLKGLAVRNDADRMARRHRTQA